MIKFESTKEEFDLIDAIANRAFRELQRDRIQTLMDIEATHCNGCGLRLNDLLKAPPFDFAHDILGIARHLDRETWALTGCFLPRYADPSK